jgi:hypothetical protein
MSFGNSIPKYLSNTKTNEHGIQANRAFGEAQILASVAVLRNWTTLCPNHEPFGSGNCTHTHKIGLRK